MKPLALRLGVIGLGRAFTVMLPTLMTDPRIRLVAATDPIASARARFEADFHAPTFDSVEALCASPDVEAVYVATPHGMHADHVCIAAAHGKHVLVEKPMAITIEDCTRMIEAARSGRVHLIVGPSHSFDRPILRTRELIESGRFGPVRMITAMDFTDFLYRPRRPEELVTEAGGGVVHSQAAHQVDVVRLLGGGLVRSVRAHTGAWDRSRPTEGAYAALLEFEGGAFASASYSGFAHYDSDELMDGIGESGLPKQAADYGAARRRLRETGSQSAATADREAALKAARNYGGSLFRMPALQAAGAAHQHFGHLVVCCSGADLRPTPKGIAIYADEERSFEPLDPPTVPRSEVIDELCDAVRLDKPPLHSGEWGRATTEVCLGILESAKSRADYLTRFQTAASPAPMQR